MSDVTVDISKGVAVLTLDRPEHLNAYTADMGRLLSQAYRECDADDDVRAIVLTGAGSAFCVGADFSGNISPFDTPKDDSAFSASPIDRRGRRQDRVAVGRPDRDARRQREQAPRGIVRIVLAVAQ